MASRAVLEDEKRFFEIVQTTPDLIEARGMLDDALEAVKMEIAQQVEWDGYKGNARVMMLSALRDRLKAEIRRISDIRVDINWKRAITEVLGQEAYEQCMAYIQMRKAEEMGKL